MRQPSNLPPGVTDADVEIASGWIPAGPRERYWMGDTTCNFCNQPCTTDLYDAVSNDGRWATMCKGCFRLKSPKRLGTGSGQQYKFRKEDKKWIKVTG